MSNVRMFVAQSKSNGCHLHFFPVPPLPSLLHPLLLVIKSQSNKTPNNHKKDHLKQQVRFVHKSPFRGEDSPMKISILGASVGRRASSTSQLSLKSRGGDWLPKIVLPRRTIITAATTVTCSFKSSVWKRFLTYYRQPPVSAHTSEMGSEMEHSRGT